MLFPHRALRADANTLANNHKGQPGLWAYGVSGDYPIVLIYIREDEDLALVQELLQAHTYWRNRHIKIDLVIELQKPVATAKRCARKSIAYSYARTAMRGSIGAAASSSSRLSR